MNNTTSLDSDRSQIGYQLWLPSLLVAVAMCIFLGFSFWRHHRRASKKRIVFLDYAALDLDVKRPRISSNLCNTYSMPLDYLQRSVRRDSLDFDTGPGYKARRLSQLKLNMGNINDDSTDFAFSFTNTAYEEDNQEDSLDVLSKSLPAANKKHESKKKLRMVSTMFSFLKTAKRQLSAVKEDYLEDKNERTKHFSKTRSADDYMLRSSGKKMTSLSPRVYHLSLENPLGLFQRETFIRDVSGSNNMYNSCCTLDTHQTHDSNHSDNSSHKLKPNDTNHILDKDQVSEHSFDSNQVHETIKDQDSNHLCDSGISYDSKERSISKSGLYPTIKHNSVNSSTIPSVVLNESSNKDTDMIEESFLKTGQMDSGDQKPWTLSQSDTFCDNSFISARELQIGSDCKHMSGVDPNNIKQCDDDSARTATTVDINTNSAFKFNPKYFNKNNSSLFRGRSVGQCKRGTDFEMSSGYCKNKSNTEAESFSSSGHLQPNYPQNNASPICDRDPLNIDSDTDNRSYTLSSKCSRSHSNREGDYRVRQNNCDGMTLLFVSPDTDSSKYGRSHSETDPCSQRNSECSKCYKIHSNEDAGSCSRRDCALVLQHNSLQHIESSSQVSTSHSKDDSGFSSRPETSTLGTLQTDSPRKFARSRSNEECRSRTRSDTGFSHTLQDMDSSKCDDSVLDLDSDSYIRSDVRGSVGMHDSDTPTNSSLTKHRGNHLQNAKALWSQWINSDNNRILPRMNTSDNDDTTKMHILERPLKEEINNFLGSPGSEVDDGSEGRFEKQHLDGNSSATQMSDLDSRDFAARNCPQFSFANRKPVEGVQQRRGSIFWIDAENGQQTMV